jgi:hypothetical protein
MRTAGLPAGRYSKGRRRGIGRWADLALPVWAYAHALACAASSGAGPGASGPRRAEPRDTRLVHEDCPVNQPGVVAEDINGDGRPDRRTLMVGSRQQCVTLDFNFDGIIDAWVYLDERGSVRRRENDFDRDGSPDEVSIYVGGALAEQQRVTARAGKIDTWHYFSAGKLTRTERDANGDDYVDQWWEYPDARGAECPLIHSDVDGDGRPDPGATVDVCRERPGSVAATPPAAAASPDEGAPSAPDEPRTDAPPAAAGAASPSLVPTGHP